MKLIHPINEKKLHELEKELDLQKNRFINAAARSAEKIQKGFSPLEWIRSSPLRSATVVFVGGFLLAQKIKEKPTLIDSGTVI